MYKKYAVIFGVAFAGRVFMEMVSKQGPGRLNFVRNTQYQKLADALDAIIDKFEPTKAELEQADVSQVIGRSLQSATRVSLYVYALQCAGRRNILKMFVGASLIQMVTLVGVRMEKPSGESMGSTAAQIAIGSVATGTQIAVYGGVSNMVS